MCSLAAQFPLLDFMSGSEITFPPAVPQSAPVSLSFPSSEGFIFYTPLTQDWGTVIKLGFESEHPFLQIWECILAQGDQCPRPQTFSSVYRGMYSEKLGKNLSVLYCSQGKMHGQIWYLAEMFSSSLS